MLENFSTSYEIARNLFLEKAASFGAIISSVVIPDQYGINGEQLFIDTAYLKAKNPKILISIFSGVHGIEGFAGSACQSMFLSDLSKYSLPPEIGVLLIHGVNPYGFSWGMRCNENNVDINRNFVNFDLNITVDNESDYKCIEDFLQLNSIINIDKFMLMLNNLPNLINRYGKAFIIDNVYRGQYISPTGLFYGGNCIELSTKRIVHLYTPIIGDYRYAINLDLHTGLGEAGSANIIFCESSWDLSYDKSIQIYGNKLTSWRDNSAVSYAFNGKLMTGLSHKFGLSKMINTTVEFGTISEDQVFIALCAANILWNNKEMLDDKFKMSLRKIIRDAFYPESPMWRKKILSQFQLVSDTVINWLFSNYIAL